jgi:hypothetical protein
MLRIRFYNRRFASRAPAVKTPSSETARRAPWVTPPAFASRSSARRVSPPRLAEDAGPPRGHPASNGSVLDGTVPASGRGAAARRFRAARGERSSFFGCVHASPVEPSGASWTIVERRVNAASAFAELVSTSGTSMPPAFASSRRLPPEKSGAGALSDTCPGAPSPLAGGRRCCTCSSTVCDLD